MILTVPELIAVAVAVGVVGLGALGLARLAKASESATPAAEEAPRIDARPTRRAGTRSRRARERGASNRIR